jgi:hypothetical protein
MFLDNALMFLKDAAFDATPVEVDTGIANVGKGEPIQIFFSGGQDIAGTTVISLQSSEVAGGPYNPLQDFAVSEDNARDGAAFYVPYPSERYLIIALSGITAGTNLNCGIVLDTHSNG